MIQLKNGSSTNTKTEIKRIVSLSEYMSIELTVSYIIKGDKPLLQTYLSFKERKQLNAVVKLYTGCKRGWYLFNNFPDILLYSFPVGNPFPEGIILKCFSKWVDDWLIYSNFVYDNQGLLKYKCFFFSGINQRIEYSWNTDSD